MSINDLRCDWCASVLAGPQGGLGEAGRRGVRFTYHPGSAALRDDSGMLCESCWAGLSAWLGDPGAGLGCSVCGAGLREGRLVISRPAELRPWLVCRSHAVEFLNRLRTVEPKFDPATFTFPESAGDTPGGPVP